MLGASSRVTGCLMWIERATMKCDATQVMAENFSPDLVSESSNLLFH